MTDIREFLLARIGEDEAKVRYMRGEADRVASAPAYKSMPTDWLMGVDIFVSPSRWAAECEKNRRIAEAAQEALAEHQIGTAKWLRVLRALALPYAGHPDFRQEWVL